MPLWTSSGTLGNSGLYQAASGFFGIGTTTPGGPLQLATAASGGANATMMLTQTNAAAGNYYANIGLYNSHGLIGNLSALGAGYPSGNLFVANDVVFLGGQQNAGTNLIFLTNTSGALKFGTGGFAPANERMRIGAAGGVSVGNSYVGTDAGAGNLIVSGNVGVGTAAPAANLEVNGTAKFDGLVTFASGQTFPGGGGSGTITGVTAASPLTGGGTSGTVTVGLNTTTLETTLNGVYARLGAANTFTYAPTFDAGLVAKVNFGSGNYGVLSYGTNGSGGFYGSSDTGYGVYGISTSGVGVSGTSTLGNAGFFSSAGVSEATVYATNTANYTSGLARPTALNASSTGTGSTGVYGSGALYGVWGATAVNDSIGVYGEAANGFAGYFANDGTVDATVYASNSSPGSSTTGPVVFSANATGVNAFGVFSYVSGNGADAVYGESDGTTDSGSGRSASGVYGAATGPDGNGLAGYASGNGGYGVYALAIGNADTTRHAPAGVYAIADEGDGVEGFAVGQSATAKSLMENYNPITTGGVWGDTSASGATGTAGGIVGSADNNSAAWLKNDSTTYPTLVAYNAAAGGTGLFKVFKVGTPAGICGIGDGDLSCTGQVKMLASTGGGARTVETYATQSAENWVEDYGTGAMNGGVGVVQIDPTFADTVTADMSYHVFLTPLGDSKGHLYVVKSSATSFEVRESGGGTSSIGFDYKIVAKRRGYEAQRFVDVTDRLHAEQEETRRRMPSGPPAQGKSVARPPVLVRPSVLPPVRPTGRPGSGVPEGAALTKKAVAQVVMQK